MEPGAYLLDRSLCNSSALRKASRRMSQFYDSVLAPSGLKATQFAILNQIDRRQGEPTMIRDLAEALVLDQSTLGQNLRPLERDGLISLGLDPTDGRRRRVTLTANGRLAFEAARPLWQAAQARFENSFGAQEAAELRATLLKIASDQSLGAGLVAEGALEIQS
jgi:DNA-binding MarR family transcriptional regulator